MARKSRSRRTRKTHYGGANSLAPQNTRTNVIKRRGNSSVKAKNALNKSLTAQELANAANAKAAKAIEEEKQAIAEQEKINQETKAELEKVASELDRKRSEIQTGIAREKEEKQRVMIAEQEQKQAELQRQLEEGQKKLQTNLAELDQKIAKAEMQSELQLKAKEKEIQNTINKQRENAKTKRNAAEKEKKAALNAAIQSSRIANQAANEAAQYAQNASTQRLLMSNGSPSGTNLSRSPRVNPNGSAAPAASSRNSGSAVTNPLNQNNQQVVNRVRKMVDDRRASNAQKNEALEKELKEMRAAAKEEAAAKEAASKIVQQPPQAAVVQSNMIQSVKAPLPLKVQRKNLENSIKSIQGRLRRENRTLTNKNKQNLQSQLKSKQNQLLQLAPK